VDTTDNLKLKGSDYWMELNIISIYLSVFIVKVDSYNIP